MAPRIPAERLLIILFRKIGDVLLSTPVLRALRQHYPQSFIAFCTEPAPAHVLRHNPHADEVIVRPRHTTWYEEWQFWRRIRRMRFDLVIDLLGNPRSAMLARVSGARHRVAFARFPRSLLYTMLVKHGRDIHEYTVAKRLRLLEPLGIQASDLSLDLAYTPSEEEQADRFLSTHGIGPDDLLICVDPTHQVPTRQWPGAHFSHLADLLGERLGARVILLWGPGEHQEVAAIAAGSRSSSPVLIPEWDLVTLAALLARADLFIGCDSAPQHIAVSQRIPSLSIFGATRSRGWLPPKAQHRAVVANLPCQPCNRNQCGPPLNIACMRTLSAEAVFEAVLACHPWVPKLRRFCRHRASGGTDTAP
jgi:ADP-heptose:LPS heptosyltransferase